MDHWSFCAWVDRVVAFVLTELLPHLPTSEWTREVERMLGDAGLIRRPRATNDKGAVVMADPADRNPFAGGGSAVSPGAEADGRDEGVGSSEAEGAHGADCTLTPGPTPTRG